MALSTKNLPVTSNVNKLMTPGTVLAKINSVELEEDKLGRQEGKDGYFLIVNLEGIDLSEQGFEGFLIDSTDPSKGKYKGQIGKVRCGSLSKTGTLYAFSSNAEKNIDRDSSILSYVKTNFAIPLNLTEQIDNIEADTIEEYIQMLSKVLVNGEFYYFTLAGKEWMKNNYPQYNLFLPKSNGKNGTPVALVEEKVIKFDEAIHVIRKKSAEIVDDFSNNSDTTFEL